MTQPISPMETCPEAGNRGRIASIALASSFLLSSCIGSPDTNAPDVTSEIETTTSLSQQSETTLLDRSNSEQEEYDKWVAERIEEAVEEFNEFFPGVCPKVVVEVVSPLDELTEQEEDKRKERFNKGKSIPIKTAHDDQPLEVRMNVWAGLGSTCQNGELSALETPRNIDLSLAPELGPDRGLADPAGNLTLIGFRGLDPVLIDKQGNEHINHSVSDALGLMTAYAILENPMIPVAPDFGYDNNSHIETNAETLAGISSGLDITLRDLLRFSAGTDPGYSAPDFIGLVFGVDKNDLTDEMHTVWYASFNLHTFVAEA